MSEPASFLGFSTADRWDHENGFYLTSGVERIAKLLAHHELYQRIVGLPGQVVECGVFKGASLIRWATFRAVHEAEFSRRIIGFDAFGTFPRVDDPDDERFIDRFEADAGVGISREDLEASLAYKGIGNVELVQGDVRQVVAEHLAARPQLRVALLHLDLDVYEPTKAALDAVWPRMVSGGIVVVDDHGTVPGATRAVDELIAEQGLRLQKLPIAHIPAFLEVP